MSYERKYTLKQLRQAWGAGKHSAEHFNYFVVANAVADYLAAAGRVDQAKLLADATDAAVEGVLNQDEDWFVAMVMWGALLERAARELKADVAIEAILIELVDRSIKLLEKEMP